MISFRPAWSRLAARLRTPSPLESQAREVIELAPAAERHMPPTICLPDDADRVRGISEGLTLDRYLEEARGGTRLHPPTIARRYVDVRIADATLYAGTAYQVVRDQRKRAVLGRPREEVAQGLFATSYDCERYFGHWLTDGQSLELLAEDRGRPALGLARAPWGQEPGYRQLTALGLRRLDDALVRDLWIVDDRPVNDGRADRMARIRRRVRSGVTPSAAGRPVFLRRVGGVPRRLANQDALGEALERRGFAVVTPEEMPAADLVALIAGAQLVVSVEGSALCHAIVAQPDRGAVLAIQPPDRVNTIQKLWCDAAGLRFAQAVADQEGGSFSISEDRILRTMDLIDRAAPL